MSTENLPVKSAYQLMDEADEQQIISDLAVDDALVYKTQGKTSLSFVGIKFLFQKWADEKQATVEIIDEHCFCRLEKDTEDDKSTWFWRAEFKLRTTRFTEDGKSLIIETKGVQENPYFQNGKYDQFGKTKAYSKAERNADRKQIPEFEITHMINQINPEHVKELNNQEKQDNGVKICICTGEKFLDNDNKSCTRCHKPFSPGVLDFMLQKKNAVEPGPEKPKEEPIEEPKNNSEDYEKYCICGNFIPNSITNGKTCQNCNKLAPKEIK